MTGDGNVDRAALFDDLSLLREQARRRNIDASAGIDLGGLLEQADCCACVTTLTDAVVYVNQQFAALHGRSRTECIGEDSFAFVAPDSRDRVRSTRSLIAGGGRASALVVRHLSRDGSSFLLRVNMFALAGASGLPAFVMEIGFRDPGARGDEPARIGENRPGPPGKGRGRPADDAREELRALCMKAPLPCQVLDENGLLLAVNDRWSEMMGARGGEAIGQAFTRFLEADSRQRFQEELALNAGEGTMTTDLEMRSLDGRALGVIVDCRIFADQTGGLRRALCILRDVTRERAAFERLREAETKARLGFWEYHVPADRMSWSEEISPLQETQGSSVQPGMREDVFGERFVTDLRHALRTGESSDGEYDVLLPDGKRRWFHGTINVDRDDSGRVARLFGMTHDITERNALELELARRDALLRQQKLALEQKDLALGELIARFQESEQKIYKWIVESLNRSVAPLVRKLKQDHPRVELRTLDLLEENLRVLAVPPRKPEGFDLSLLTRRELEVCQLIRQGLSSKEIAQSLSISLKSVHTHRNHIRKKLGLLNKGMNLTGYLRTVFE